MLGLKQTLKALKQVLIVMDILVRLTYTSNLDLFMNIGCNVGAEYTAQGKSVCLACLRPWILSLALAEKKENDSSNRRE